MKDKDLLVERVSKKTNVKKEDIFKLANDLQKKDLNNEDNLKAIARVIKDNLLKLYNIEDNKRLYKVCVGCYKERSNAIKVLNVAKSKGFGDAYII